MAVDCCLCSQYLQSQPQCAKIRPTSSSERGADRSGPGGWWKRGAVAPQAGRCTPRTQVSTVPLGSSRIQLADFLSQHICKAHSIYSRSPVSTDSVSKPNMSKSIRLDVSILITHNGCPWCRPVRAYQWASSAIPATNFCAAKDTSRVLRAAPGRGRKRSQALSQLEESEQCAWTCVWFTIIGVRTSRRRATPKDVVQRAGVLLLLTTVWRVARCNWGFSD